MAAINEESILRSIKKLLMVPEEDSAFDQDITIHINTVLSNLVQMGVGPQDGIILDGENTTWQDFIGESTKQSQVKSYVYIKVKLLFDPPANSSSVESLNRQAAELEYRLYTENGGY